MNPVVAREIHPEACWQIHITCPLCGAPVTPVALGADAPLLLDTRAIVECQPCGERWLIDVSMTTERAARRAHREIATVVAASARAVERERESA